MATGPDPDPTKSFFGQVSPNEEQQTGIEEHHEDEQNLPPPDKTDSDMDEGKSRLVYNKSDLSLKRLVAVEDNRINLPSYQQVSYITQRLHCNEKGKYTPPC